MSDNLAEIRTEAYPGERLVVCHNPLLAEYRRHKRQDLLASTEEALAKIAREVARRTKTPLLAPQIAEKVGRVKNRYKVAKHFEMVIEDGRFEYARRHEAIEREKQLDGFYIIRTSEPEERLATDDVVRSYKNLTNVERGVPISEDGRLCRSVPSVTGRRSGCGRTCSCACSPTTSSGICAEPWRRCCSMTRTWTRTGRSGTRCGRRSRRRRPNGRSPNEQPRMGSRSTASQR